MDSPVRSLEFPSSDPDQGFTLLELLVALTLLGFIFAFVAGSIQFGARVWERGDRFSQRTAELRVAQTIVRRHISQAMAVFETGGKRSAKLLFRGRADSIRFASGAPAQLRSRHNFALSVTVGGTGSEKDLVLSWAPLHPDFSNFEGPTGEESSILVDRIEHAEFSYFGSIGPNAEPQWHLSWEDQVALPRLVRLTVRFSPGDDRVWPELVAATHNETVTRR